MPDQATVLLQKAREDEHLALLVVDDKGVTDEQVGFFCQQAVEKAMKAVLTVCGLRYRRTHDLAELIDLLRDRSVKYPGDLDESVWLTPFAAEMRYDYLPPEQEEPFDRAAAVKLVRVAIEWAETIVPTGTN